MIREPRPEEIEILIDLMLNHAQDCGVSSYDPVDRTYLKENMRNAFMYQDHKIYVFEREKKFIGYILGKLDEQFWNRRRFGEIVLFYIEPEYRNKYHADMLFNHMTQWFNEHSCSYVMSSIFCMKNDYTINDRYVERGRQYFLSQNMNEVGYTFVLPTQEGI
ncbi:glucosamine 6-phosphate N-acetyltransferase [Phage DSL-LC06]|nr:glucosamine 6-phosphate N-acetyltransferase [Phage DSL-LC06]